MIRIGLGGPDFVASPGASGPLVADRGIDRAAVTFTGYWRFGKTEADEYTPEELAELDPPKLLQRHICGAGPQGAELVGLIAACRAARPQAPLQC